MLAGARMSAAAQQLALFGHRDQGEKLKRTALTALLEVVDRVGTKVCAPEVDQSPSNLRLAIREVERHVLSLDDFFTLLTFDAASVLSAIAEATGHFPLVRRPEMTDAEELDALKRELARLGPVGEVILSKAHGGRP